MARTKVATKKTKVEKVKKVEKKAKEKTPAVVKAPVVTPPPPPALVPPPPPPEVPAPKPVAPPKPTVLGPPKMKFQLLSGIHYVRSKNRTGQVRHTPGDIIEDFRNLELVFPNKFKRLIDEIVIPDKVKTRATKAAKRAVHEMSDAIRGAKKRLGKKPVLTVVNRGGNQYDVIREDDGKPVNDRFLTLEEAKALESKGNALVDVEMQEPLRSEPEAEAAPVKDEEDDKEM